MVKVQDYIDQNYPKAQRVRVQKLDLRNLDLEGDLDLKDFTHYCFKVIITGNPRLGEIKNKSEWYTAIINKIYSTTQEWLEQEYSQKEQTKEIILSGIEFEQPSELIISDYPNVKEIKTEGYFQNEILNITKVTINNCPRLEEVCIPNFSNQFLSLHHLPSLKKFHCGYGKLTGRLDLTPFANLESVHCFGNQFTEINLPAEKLEELAASGNNFGQRDLSFLGHLVNLKVLQIGNNQLIGSLKHLKNLNKLNFLTICDTDIASGLEYLSDELTIGINCYTTKTPAGKVQAIAKQLAPCYNNVSAWKKVNPELVNNAKQIKELDILSNNLRLAFNNHVNTNKANSLFQSLDNWISNEITFLERQNQRVWEAKIQVSPKQS